MPAVLMRAPEIAATRPIVRRQHTHTHTPLMAPPEIQLTKLTKSL